MRFHCFASCIKAHLRFASWPLRERSDGLKPLSPASVDVLYFKFYKTYSVVGKLAADIPERNDASLGLKGSP